MLKQERDRTIRDHERRIKHLENQLLGEKTRIDEILKILKTRQYNQERKNERLESSKRTD